MLTLANSMGVAMETIGFCESFLDMLLRYVFGFTSILSAGRTNDLRLLGVICLILLLVLAIGGMDWVTRVMVVLLVRFLLFKIVSFKLKLDIEKNHYFFTSTEDDF